MYNQWGVASGIDVADFDDDPFTNDPDYWHGTHVAGIVGAETDNGMGVSSIGYNVRILPVKATRDGEDPNLITSGLEGIVWAVTNGADIINLSWGYEIPIPPDVLFEHSLDPTLESALLLAKHNDVLVVAAAGNQSSDMFFYPAICEDILAVANTDESDNKALNSNFGDWVDICAPGENIYSTFPGNSYLCRSGTSMSAPLVAGTAALMLSANPALTSQDVIDCIRNTADDISHNGLPGIELRLNARAALECVVQQSPDSDEDEEEETISLNLQLTPNPMKNKAVISYDLPNDTKVYLNIYDKWGRLVAQPIPVQYESAGSRQYYFYRSGLRAGTYFCRLITRSHTESVKFVIDDF